MPMPLFLQGVNENKNPVIMHKDMRFHNFFNDSQNQIFYVIIILIYITNCLLLYRIR